MDPCTFKFIGVNDRGARELQGLVIVEVDDLLCLGNEGTRTAQTTVHLRQALTFSSNPKDARSMAGG